MLAPMCLRCKVQTVPFHEMKATDARQARSYFECPSCFEISSEPFSYVIEHIPAPMP
jgi:hypothetical protein